MLYDNLFNLNSMYFQSLRIYKIKYTSFKKLILYITYYYSKLKKEISSNDTIGGFVVMNINNSKNEARNSLW